MPLTDPHTRPEYDRAALITIDVQNDTLDGGTFEIPGTSAALPSIKRLCDAFRQAGLPIVHVIRIYTPDAADADRCRRSVLRSGSCLLLKGSCGCRLADALLPAPDIDLDEDRLLTGDVQRIGPQESILFKPRWGAFYRTALESLLREKAISTLVFCGCNFPNCTRASIYQASERDFRVVAVVDAISNISPPDVSWLKTIGVSTVTTDAASRYIEAVIAPTANTR
jgi:nicotinamidase-related amidase